MMEDLLEAGGFRFNGTFRGDNNFKAGMKAKFEPLISLTFIEKFQ
jgi:hypothetical protein